MIALHKFVPYLSNNRMDTDVMGVIAAVKTQTVTVISSAITNYWVLILSIVIALGVIGYVKRFGRRVVR